MRDALLKCQKKKIKKKEIKKMIEREIRKTIIKYAEDINLIYSAEECEECITPTIAMERDRRTDFIRNKIMKRRL